MTGYNETWKMFNGFRSSLRNETYTSWRENLSSLVFVALYIVDNVFYFFFIFFFFARESTNQVQGFYGELFAPLFFLHRSVLGLRRKYICANTPMWSSYVTESLRCDTHDACSTWRLVFLIVAVAWSITDRWQRGKNWCCFTFVKSLVNDSWDYVIVGK